VKAIDNRVPVTGHLTATTAREATDAGVGGLEHLLLTLYRDLAPTDHALGEGETMATMDYWGKVRRGWEAIDAKGGAAKSLIGAMAQREMRMIPTLVLGARTDTSFTDEEDKAFTAAQNARPIGRNALGGPSPEELKRSADNLIAVIAAMHNAGVRVLPGTDCGAVPVPPGYGYHIELSLLAQAMPNADVLAAATSRAAAWLRRDDLGSIAPGKRADIVLIDGDPLRNIRDARNVTATYINGQRLKA
jgi:hypothetical protein